ncbi:MAG: hypothetical protein IK028_03545 [Bacilli bacterium]|nr:hypothetical protein [Bacilli bacterium]
MVIIGILTGLFEIVVGIVAIVNSKGEWSLYVPGIIYILSGLLFLWICVGAQTAFEDSKKIEAMKSDLEKVTEKNKLLEEEIEKLKSDKENESK